MDWRHMFCLWIPINKLSRQGNTIGNQDTKACKLNKRNIQVIARFFFPDTLPVSNMSKYELVLFYTDYTEEEKLW